MNKNKDNYVEVGYGEFKLWIESDMGFQIHTVTKIRDFPALYAIKVGYGEPKPNEIMEITLREV